jgi:hypothetical protein
VDDCCGSVPDIWLERGGVLLPMYQSEAMWLHFNSSHIEDGRVEYPFAIKVAAGKINAITGNSWSDGLLGNPQNYMVAPEQPWIDGYCVEKGLIRQFVAMPLGSGYSAEEQLTGDPVYGGIQIAVYPMKRAAFERNFPKVTKGAFTGATMKLRLSGFATAPDMAIAPGGLMRQEIYDDPFDLDDWEIKHKSRCFVHLANSLVWRAITGEAPPTTPFTAKEYTNHGLPWFEYYSDNSTALKGAEKLKKLKSVAEKGKEKGDVPLPENESVIPNNIKKLRKNLKKDQVREGQF